jgi:hypothetical protein
MCGRHALVVRKAPSRWTASIFFHSAMPLAAPVMIALLSSSFMATSGYFSRTRRRVC